MEHMYLDKGGSAAVLGALLGLVELKYPVRNLLTLLVVIYLITQVNVVIGLGVAENAVDGRSYRPSDIIRSLNVIFDSIMEVAGTTNIFLL